MKNAISQLSLFGDKNATPTLQIAGCCLKCESTKTKLGAGRKPGEASLYCSECKKFIRWVSEVEFKKLNNGGAA